MEADVVLHCCCAPCSCAVIEQLLNLGLSPVLFFYNPNIHPAEEYERRKGELRRYAGALQLDFVEGEYVPADWHAAVPGLQHEPEGGRRCYRCFLLRMEETARYAHEHHISTIATTLGMSRWKNLEHVTGAGHEAASRFLGLSYLDANWRKGPSGTARMAEISKKESFYRQRYCGCVYSFR